MPTRRRKWAARQCVACSSTGILVLMPDRTAKTVRPRSRPHVLSAMRREWAKPIATQCIRPLRRMECPPRTVEHARAYDYTWERALQQTVRRSGQPMHTGTRTPCRTPGAVSPAPCLRPGRTTKISAVSTEAVARHVLTRAQALATRNNKRDTAGEAGNVPRKSSRTGLVPRP
ncbi:unnamed protein product [Prorocentrum cordatum]|uniref:Uncharacterized protein n=1 Tax=Prorocentrum cordatum TaxID=2364126 RepID=A0ABN9V5E7_9DINO|nr:unnamed protein product [Polarella glacialis]